MLDGLHDQKYRIERLESCMLGNGHVQFGGGPMEQGSSLYLASGLPNSLLSEFRSRLLAHGAERRLFDLLLQQFGERGWIKARGKQRTDSTHVLAAIRTLRRLECVGETMRHALDVLAEVAPDWLLEHMDAEWAERYRKRFSDFRLPKDAKERVALAETIGADGRRLLERVYAESRLPWF